METILFLAHTEDDGSLSKSAREALAAAAALRDALPGASLSVGLVAAGDGQAAADSIAGCGAARFVAVTGADFAAARYATDAAAAEALAKSAGATLVALAGGRGATHAWPRGYACGGHRGGRRGSHGDPMVLPAEDRGHAAAA